MDGGTKNKTGTRTGAEGQEQGTERDRGGLVEEMLPTLAVCEWASVTGGGVGRLLFVFRVSMVAASGAHYRSRHFHS